MSRGHIIRIHRAAYDPAKLIGTALTGDCFEPYFRDGTWGFFERDAPWQDGDVCLIRDSRRSALIAKAVYSVEGGQVLCSNLPATWFRPEYQRILGPLAISVELPAWRVHQFAEESVAQCAQNAGFRRVVADYFARPMGRTSPTGNP